MAIETIIKDTTYYLYPLANTVRPSVDAGEMIMPA